MSGAKPQYDVLNAGAITTLEEGFQRLGQFHQPLGVCAICFQPVFQTHDDNTYPYFGAAQEFGGIKCPSATKPGNFVVCHSEESCMKLFKSTSSGKAHFARVSSAATSKECSLSCMSNGCTSCPTIKRLKNGSLQYWCKSCLNAYYEARDAFSSKAIEHAGGLDKAKRSLKRTDGKFLGKCMECNEHVLDSHENMVTLQRCYVHIGCLG
jgi:hypothetical protein